MEKPPRGRGERLVSHRRLLAYALIGALTAALTLLALWWFLPHGERKARAAAFALFTLEEILRSLAFRSEELPFYRLSLRKNKALAVGLAASAALSLLPLYTPLAAVFELEPLSAAELALVTPFILVPLAAIEAGKAALRAQKRAGR